MWDDVERDEGKTLVELVEAGATAAAIDVEADNNDGYDVAGSAALIEAIEAAAAD